MNQFILNLMNQGKSDGQTGLWNKAKSLAGNFSFKSILSTESKLFQKNVDVPLPAHMENFTDGQELSLREFLNVSNMSSSKALFQKLQLLTETSTSDQSDFQIVSVNQLGNLNVAGQANDSGSVPAINLLLKKSQQVNKTEKGSIAEPATKQFQGAQESDSDNVLTLQADGEPVVTIPTVINNTSISSNVKAVENTKIDKQTVPAKGQAKTVKADGKIVTNPVAENVQNNGFVKTQKVNPSNPAGPALSSDVSESQDVKLPKSNTTQTIVINNHPVVDGSANSADVNVKAAVSEKNTSAGAVKNFKQIKKSAENSKNVVQSDETKETLNKADSNIVENLKTKPTDNAIKNNVNTFTQVNTNKESVTVDDVGNVKPVAENDGSQPTVLSGDNVSTPEDGKKSKITLDGFKITNMTDSDVKNSAVNFEKFTETEKMADILQSSDVKVKNTAQYNEIDVKKDDSVYKSVKVMQPKDNDNKNQINKNENNNVSKQHVKGSVSNEQGSQSVNTTLKIEHVENTIKQVNQKTDQSFVEPEDKITAKISSNPNVVISNTDNVVDKKEPVIKVSTGVEQKENKVDNHAFLIVKDKVEKYKETQKQARETVNKANQKDDEKIYIKPHILGLVGNKEKIQSRADHVEKEQNSVNTFHEEKGVSEKSGSANNFNQPNMGHKNNGNHDTNQQQQTKTEAGSDNFGNSVNKISSVSAEKNEVFHIGRDHQTVAMSESGKVSVASHGESADVKNVQANLKVLNSWLSDGAKIMVMQDEKYFNVRTEISDIGKLHIQMQQEKQNVEVTIRVENEQSKVYLEQSVQELKQSLAQKDIVLTQVRVLIGEKADREFSGQSQFTERKWQDIKKRKNAEITIDETDATVISRKNTAWSTYETVA